MTATKAPEKAKTKAKKSTKKKLTLSLNQEVIEQGKFFAKEQGMSLSALIEQFLLDKIKKDVYVPVMVIEPDAELGRLFPPRPNSEHLNKSIYEMRDEYYSSILARPQIEEE